MILKTRFFTRLPNKESILFENTKKKNTKKNTKKTAKNRSEGPYFILRFRFQPQNMSGTQKVSGARCSKLLW